MIPPHVLPNIGGDPLEFHVENTLGHSKRGNRRGHSGNMVALFSARWY